MYNVISLELPCTFTQPLTPLIVAESDAATLVCETSKSNQAVTWLCNGKPISPNEHVKLESDGNKHSLSIDKANVDDSAEYTAKIGNVETSAPITVEG